MKVEWDYTNLAEAYLKRPGYSGQAIDEMLSVAGLKKQSKICDIGAGVAHLSIMLEQHGHEITAIEPNEKMRYYGIIRTKHLTNIRWHNGTAEQTGQMSNTFDMVTFGSSFNVCDRHAALSETARILIPGGWFACMWNHRRLDDPIQSEIERIIKKKINTFGYGIRRQNQTSILEECGLFRSVVEVSSTVVHEQKINEWIEAWRSHATLKNQAKNSFEEIIESISDYLKSFESDTIKVPYLTNIWMAQLS